MLGVGLVAGACNGSGDVGTTGQPDDPVGPSADADAAPITIHPPTFWPDAQPVEPIEPSPCEDPRDVDAGPFEPYVVSHDDVGRSVIYSWTTAEQIAELRADPTLLTRSMTADGQRGRAADYIIARAPYDEIAAILARPEFERKRFGWANPWATVMGWEGETYGAELLEIRLRPDSLIGRLDAELGEWAFFDVNNAPVDLETVKASPERIAAVYFVDGTHSQDCPEGSFTSGVALREYFVCNEAMIEGWSAYTVEIRAELDRSIAALTGLRDALSARGCVDQTEDMACWRNRVVDLWAQDPESVLQGYEAALAIPSAFYMPFAANIDALIAQLEAVLFDPAPLVHQNP